MNTHRNKPFSPILQETGDIWQQSKMALRLINPVAEKDDYLLDLLVELGGSTGE
jgi:hypothetical protein